MGDSSFNETKGKLEPLNEGTIFNTSFALNVVGKSDRMKSARLFLSYNASVICILFENPKTNNMMWYNSNTSMSNKMHNLLCVNEIIYSQIQPYYKIHPITPLMIAALLVEGSTGTPQGSCAAPIHFHDESIFSVSPFLGNSPQTGSSE